VCDISEVDTILLMVLGATDAIWLPDRQSRSHKRHTLIYERRQAFNVAGVLIRNLAGEGADEAQRQRSTRALRQAVAKKLLTVHHPKWARAIGCNLTVAGDFRARSLADLPVYNHAQLARLAAHQDSPMTMDARRFVYTKDGPKDVSLPWIPEVLLAGVRDAADPDQRAKLVRLEDELLPLIVSAEICSAANIHGGVWYAATLVGREVLRGPAPPLPALPEPVDEARQLYFAALQAANDNLETAPPRCAGEIGELCLPVSYDHPRPGCSAAWAAFWAEGNHATAK
jgi:hypothetical protein